MYFQNCGFRKTRIKKYLKSPLSKKQSRSNMKGGPNILEI